MTQPIVHTLSKQFFKSRVYVNPPWTIQELKPIIREEIANITPAMLVSVMTKTENDCLHSVLTIGVVTKPI